MRKLKYNYWKEEDFWLGYLEEFPHYWTQGKSEEELQDNLNNIYFELKIGNHLPVIG